MINFFREKKDYFLVLGISFLIFIALFLIKGIYPFGNNTLIFGDMYDQITAYYYYLYDCFRGNESIFVNFASSNGVNFFGIITYYLLSPFTLLILLVERSKIHLFISVIIVLKIIVCNITCLYMIKKVFKNMNSLLSVSLALLYGFSAYSLNYYQITAWIDVMYMMPLIIIGIKKLFDDDNPKMYLITLTLSLYFSFYISLMVVIFIFLLSFFYLYVYFKKKDIGKKILGLGITTLLSIGSSLVVLIPTYKQISISARMSNSLEALVNSKFGPLTDKLALFLFGPLLFIGLLLLIIKYKENMKFLKFYIPSMILLLLPIFIEPINKILHFGSYASFTYRFGFITILFLIIGAGYFFDNCKMKKIKNIDINITISSLITVIISCITIIVFIKYYNCIQNAVDFLTLSRDKMLFIILIGILIINFIGILLIYILNKGINRYSLNLFFIITVIHLTCNTFAFVGVDKIQGTIKVNYDNLNQISKDYDVGNYYRYKDESNIIINNASMVNKMPSMDFFSSLTNASNQKTLKLLGYTSYWTHTHSLGGTRFSDVLLGNKYIISTDDNKDGYSLKKEYDDLYLLESDKDVSYGYLIKQNISIKKYNNTFEIQNAIYESITGEKDLFKVVDDITYNNIKVEDKKYEIGKDSYIEFKVSVPEKSQVYLELYSSLNNGKNADIFESFDIYVNDKLYLKNYPDEDNNGLIDFGVFEDDEITIKVVFLDDCYLESLNVGVMNLDKYNNFVSKNKIDYDLGFNKNKINLNIEVDESKILFIPISYDESYIAYNNGNKAQIVKVYDNFIGIKLNEGENDISIKFVPQYLIISFIISIIFVVLDIIMLKTNLYEKILNINVLQIIAKYIYLGIYTLAIIGIYLLPIIVFLISFIKYIKL